MEVPVVSRWLVNLPTRFLLFLSAKVYYTREVWDDTPSSVSMGTLAVSVWEKIPNFLRRLTFKRDRYENGVFCTSVRCFSNFAFISLRPQPGSFFGTSGWHDGTMQRFSSCWASLSNHEVKGNLYSLLEICWFAFN